MRILIRQNFVWSKFISNFAVDKTRVFVANSQSKHSGEAIRGNAMQTALGADVGLKANKDCKSLISRIFRNMDFPSGTTP